MPCLIGGSLYFIFGAFVFCIGVLILFYIMADFFIHDGMYKCRDEMVSQVPIYPNSTLISTSKPISETNPYRDDVDQSYLVLEGFDAVVAFYSEKLYGCHIRSSEQSAYCSGTVENSLLWYEITISNSGSNTTYTIDLHWQCGLPI